MSTPAALDWTDLDQKAVDTARVLAMDAVQKVGNGHPGTAMSLAPAAYLLFQKVMRHDPADPHWIARDRFVLSVRPLEHHALHPALPRRLRPRARRPQGAAHLGPQDPGPPRATATPPASRSRPARSARASANAVGMAMAARRVHGLLDPEAAPGESLFDHHVYAIVHRRRPRGGRERRGRLDRRHPAARQPDADLRRQQDLDRGRHRHRVHRGRRGALRGLRLARAGRRLDQRRHRVRRGRPRPATTRSAPPRPSPTSRSFIVLRHDHRLARAQRAGHRGRPHGTALGDDEVAATKEVLGFDPSQTFEVPADVIAHTRRLARARCGVGRRVGRAVRRLGRREPRPGRRCCTGSRPARCPTGWADGLPAFEADAKGVATRQGLRAR